MTTMNLEELVKYGNADGLLWALLEIPVNERVDELAPLRSVATAIFHSPSGEEDGPWMGPLSEGHSRAACMVLFPTLESVIEDIPFDHHFVEFDMPQLFEQDLARILVAWGERYLKRPDNSDEVASMLKTKTWWDIQEIYVPMTKGIALLYLLGGMNASQIYAWLCGRDELAYRLVRAAFHQPGSKGAMLELADTSEMYPDSLGGFLIPSLIRASVLTQGEVIDWCEHALAMDERTKRDKAWFARLKSYLESTTIDVLPGFDDRYWLEPHSQIINAYLDEKAGVSHPLIEARPELERILPFIGFKLHTELGGLMAGLADLHRKDEPELVNRAIDVLRESGLADAADVVEEANLHAASDLVNKTEPTGEEPDEWWETASELDERWYANLEAIEDWMADLLSV